MLQIIHYFVILFLIVILCNINPFSTGTHFCLEICVQLDHFVDIREGVWRSKD
ncbi:hypothetical protein E2C01_025119 [Portunus trituberculatus]|uniref:Uncharacterized protein n=1 Tax=Portunus trituberculatus TaxID=210409 RepID=A0A5B7EC57_PORTR|nr:hypothetical protein [Portunus trituberculatus]